MTDEPETFVCTRCKETRPADELASSGIACARGKNRSRGGFFVLCTTCVPPRPHKEFGEKLRGHRKRHPYLSMLDISRLFGLLGYEIKPSDISNWEMGRCLPPRELVVEYAGLLRVKSETLVAAWEAEQAAN